MDKHDGIRRPELARMIKGRGASLDDIQLPGMCFAVFVWSQYAHANIKSINVDDALNVPGAIAVITPDEVLPADPAPAPNATPSRSPAFPWKPRPRNWTSLTAKFSSPATPPAGLFRRRRRSCPRRLPGGLPPGERRTRPTVHPVFRPAPPDLRPRRPHGGGEG